MTTNIEENKTLVRRFFAAIESGDLAIFDQIVAVDYSDHLQGQSPGRETLKRYFTGLRSAFADLKTPITAIVAEGDLVAVLNSVRGTHTGEFGTLKATGNPVDAMAFQLYRIANGQLAEHWEVADLMTLMRQLQHSRSEPRQSDAQRITGGASALLAIVDSADPRTTRNKNNILAFYDLMINQRKPVAAVNEYVGSTYIQHNPLIPDGAQALGEFFGRAVKDRPKLHVKVHKIIAIGDYVWTHVNFVNLYSDDPRMTAVLLVWICSGWTAMERLSNTGTSFNRCPIRAAAPTQMECSRRPNNRLQRTVRCAARR